MADLHLSNIDAYYGQSHVLSDVSLAVEEDSLVVLIGRNGAGKTTTLKAIMNSVDVRSGTIEFDGEEIVGLEPHEVSGRGIAYVPENRRIFHDLTVEENLKIGYIGHDSTRGEELLENVFGYFPRLEERLDQRAGNMSGGEQQMLAIGRALVSDPKFLLVDEPTEGLMPTLVEALKEALVEINRNGTPILLVEQNATLALDISDYCYIIDEGVIQEEGTSDEVRKNQELIEEHLALG